eukprot:scaffold112967_cov19-Tisochrysis_lutea.AAC.2
MQVAYIKFEQGSSVQAARQSPPTIGTQRCEVLPMVPEYVNGPQPGMRGIGASRGGFRSGGAPRRGGPSGASMPPKEVSAPVAHPGKASFQVLRFGRTPLYRCTQARQASPIPELKGSFQDCIKDYTWVRTKAR